jgi:LPXTG-motif cell wall-anchored protein
MTVSAEKIVEEPTVEIAMNTPAKLPKTGSPLFLVGLLGLMCIGASSAVGLLRRS